MNQFTKQIGARLRAARKAAGYESALWFTKKFKLSASTYSQHETGQRVLTLATLMKYSELLEIEPNWLLTGVGAPYKAQQAEKELFLTTELNHPLCDGKFTHLTYQTISKNLCTVDMKLFCEILSEVLTVTSAAPKLRNDECIDFCIDIYNVVVTTTVDDVVRLSIIKLAATSILKGYQASEIFSKVNVARNKNDTKIESVI